MEKDQIKEIGIIYLTEHFKLSEFLRSNTAETYDLCNIPDWDIIVNLNRLARRLEKVRNIIDMPIFINSGYRSPEVNAFVNGARNSYHIQGLAADIRCDNMDKLLKALSEFTWSEFIDYKNYIHVAL